MKTYLYFQFTKSLCLIALLGIFITAEVRSGIIDDIVNYDRAISERGIANWVSDGATQIINQYGWEITDNHLGPEFSDSVKRAIETKSLLERNLDPIMENLSKAIAGDSSALDNLNTKMESFGQDAADTFIDMATRPIQWALEPTSEFIETLEYTKDNVEHVLNRAQQASESTYDAYQWVQDKFNEQTGQIVEDYGSFAAMGTKNALVIDEDEVGYFEENSSYFDENPLPDTFGDDVVEYLQDNLGIKNADLIFYHPPESDPYFNERVEDYVKAGFVEKVSVTEEERFIPIEEISTEKDGEFIVLDDEAQDEELDFFLSEMMGEDSMSDEQLQKIEQGIISNEIIVEEIPQELAVLDAEIEESNRRTEEARKSAQSQLEFIANHFNQGLHAPHNSYDQNSNSTGLQTSSTSVDQTCEERRDLMFLQVEDIRRVISEWKLQFGRGIFSDWQVQKSLDMYHCVARVVEGYIARDCDFIMSLPEPVNRCEKEQEEAQSAL